MELPDLPFTITDWSQLPATEHAGETGHALWRTQDIDGVRVRMVEYSPGYLADHWCDKGHILLVLKQKGTEAKGDGGNYSKPQILRAVAAMSDRMRGLRRAGLDLSHRGVSPCRVSRAWSFQASRCTSSSAA